MPWHAPARAMQKIVNPTHSDADDTILFGSFMQTKRGCSQEKKINL